MIKNGFAGCFIEIFVIERETILRVPGGSSPEIALNVFTEYK